MAGQPQPVPVELNGGLFITMGQFVLADDINRRVEAVEAIGGWDSLEVDFKFRCRARPLCYRRTNEHTLTLSPRLERADTLHLGHEATLQFKCPRCPNRWASVDVVMVHPPHTFVRAEFEDRTTAVPVRVFDLNIRQLGVVVVQENVVPKGVWRIVLPPPQGPRIAKFGTHYWSKLVTMTGLIAHFLPDPPAPVAVAQLAAAAQDPGDEHEQAEQ